MRERATAIYPVAIAAALPVAGIVLALVRFSENDRREAGVMAAAAILGAAIWAIVLTA